MQLTIGQCATLACIHEATAPKPGNVHRGSDFDDLTYPDLLAAAVAIGPAMESAATNRVGTVVLEAVRATRAVVGTNANLGTVLLLAPLAAVPRETPLGDGIGSVLKRLEPADARDVYEAIRVAKPGGMGRVAEADVADLESPPPANLLDAMRLAADRDLVARQFVNGFHEVLIDAAGSLAAGFSRGWTAGETIVHTHLVLMSRFPDSLIAQMRHQGCAASVGSCRGGARGRLAARRIVLAGLRGFGFLATVRRASSQSGHDGRSDRRGFVCVAARGHNDLAGSLAIGCGAREVARARRERRG